MAKKHKAIPHGANYAQVLAAEKRKKEQEREIESQMRTQIFVQRALWLSSVSVADAYGFGPKRMEAYFKALQENSDEFERMVEEYDYEYALEKLRQKAERISGTELDYLFEKELRELEKRKEGK